MALSGIGSGLGAGFILALGLASLMGDAISMAVADFLATKSDDEYMKAEEARERAEIESDFESERREMVHIYRGIGLEEKVAEEIVDILSSNKEGFLKVMMIEELKIIPG